jgi:hypothetical protein
VLPWRKRPQDDCGNEGYIGISPDGSQHHVVVPVDRQIARGLKFWVPPDDGTPFGGYKGWHYFCCLTFRMESWDEKGECISQLEKAKENGWLIQRWGKGLGLKISLIDDMKEDPGPFEG